MIFGLQIFYVEVQSFENISWQNQLFNFYATLTLLCQFYNIIDTAKSDSMMLLTPQSLMESDKFYVLTSGCS